MQTVRHRDYFLPVAHDDDADRSDPDEHAEPPSQRAALQSPGLLLVAVVGLAKIESKPIENAVAAAGFRRPPWAS